MVLSIKHEILSQLRRIGLHFEPMMLRVLPPDQAASMINEDGIGRTFAIDLPPDTNTILPHADKINRSIIKVNSNIGLFAFHSIALIVHFTKEFKEPFNRH